MKLLFDDDLNCLDKLNKENNLIQIKSKINNISENLNIILEDGSHNEFYPVKQW